MQTYTHGALGALTGAVCFPHDPLAQVACVAGSMVPDGPITLIYLRDKLGKGVYNQAGLSKLDWAIYNGSHSFVVWAFTGLAFYTLGWFAVPAMQAFFLGAVAFHVVVDTLTHNGRKIGMLDAEYLWPFGTFQVPFAWEYRTAEDYLWPKPFEAVVLVVAIVATILLHLR